MQLVAEVFQVEALALLDLLRQLLGLVAVEVLLGLFDQAEHVAHAEDARGHAVGMERIERFALLAHAEELDRLAGDRPYRERGTATRVAIDLGQDHAGQRQGVIEGLGGVGGVLPGHGIDHEQGFRRLDRRVHLLDLVHHVGIDVQAACGIDDHHVDELQPRLADRRLGDGHRLLADVGREEGYADLARQGFQLLDRGGTVDVGGNHHHRLLLPFLKEARQLARGGGLARALQAGHQDHRRRRDAQRQVLVGRPHQLLELGANDLHERLSRGQALRDLGTDGALLDLVDEVLDHRQGHVGLEQGHAHFAQSVLDVVLGQLGLAGDMAKRLREAVCKVFEHARSFHGGCGKRRIITKSASRDTR